MSSLSPQYVPSPQHAYRELSGTSLALICVFFCCFVAIVYLSIKVHRGGRTTSQPSSPARRFTARRRRPRLWEIWLDKHLGGSVHNWRSSTQLSLPVQLLMTSHVHIKLPLPPDHFCATQPLAAWRNDGAMRVHSMTKNHIALAQAWTGRVSTFFPGRREAIQFPASSPPILPPDSDPRINVAVLVAMPRRKDAQPAPGSMLHPSDKSALLYDEGQLELGVTSLFCEQTMYERTTEDSLHRTLFHIH